VNNKQKPLTESKKMWAKKSAFYLTSVQLLQTHVVLICTQRELAQCVNDITTEIRELEQIQFGTKIIPNKQFIKKIWHVQKREQKKAVQFQTHKN
jgi:hypothetical protein